MQTPPKRKGGFRTALRGRADVVQALLDVGLTWQEVADHFSTDISLGGHSAAHFMSEWSKLKRAGLTISPEYRDQLRWQLLQRTEGYAGWQVWQEWHHG